MTSTLPFAPVLATVATETVVAALVAFVAGILLAIFLLLHGRLHDWFVRRTRAGVCQEILSRFRRDMASRIGSGGVTSAVSGDDEDGMARLLAYAHIAEALSGGYECVYYIDLKTNHFDQFRSQGLYETIKVEKAGEDFFGLTQRLLPETMHPDDVPRMAAAFTHDAMVEATMGDRVFSITYRLNIEGDYLWYNFRAVRAAGDRNHLVAAVSNVDAQMRSEKRPEARPAGGGAAGGEPPSSMKLSAG